MHFLSRFMAIFLVVTLTLLPCVQAQEGGATQFKKEEIEQLVAPIALYPDALVAQILMASTYPLEVVSAARWSKANPNVKDKALEEAMQKQTWDPSVLPPPGTTDASSIATGTGKNAGLEIKEWQAIMDHLRRLPVKNKGELPVIPVDARAAEVRAIKAA